MIGTNQIGVVVRDLALQDRGDAFESHAGVDGGTRQRRHAPPDESRLNCMKTRFQISTNRPPPSSGNCFVFPAGSARFGTEIVVDLRTGAARSGIAHLPEVVFLVEAEDAVLRDAGDFLPELFGFVVFAEDGDIELVFRQAVVLGDADPRRIRWPRP